MAESLQIGLATILPRDTARFEVRTATTLHNDEQSAAVKSANDLRRVF